LSRWLGNHRLNWLRRRQWRRGNDRRSLLEAYRQRRAGEPGVVHVFGDSQSAVYEGLPNVIVHRTGGVTMYRMGRDGVPFVQRLQKRLGHRSVLMFVFGGIDARLHVGRVAEENGCPVAEVIDELVDSFLTAIDAARQGRRVLVVGVLPPAPNDAIGAEFGCWGTQEQRVAVARALNERLARRCADLGFGFVDHYDQYCDERGGQRPGLSADGVHLKREVRAPAIDGVRSALRALTAGECR
jgi:hypothetical protein